MAKNPKGLVKEIFWGPVVMSLKTEYPLPSIT